jgi:heme/copper-type cytochrome/quinol oxidase subunit 2
MPIEVHVVSQQDYEAWLDGMAEEHAGWTPEGEEAVQLAEHQQ